MLLALERGLQGQDVLQMGLALLLVVLTVVLAFHHLLVALTQLLLQSRHREEFNRRSDHTLVHMES